MPTFQEAMLPILKVVADGQIHSSRECYSHIEDVFDLTDAEKSEFLPSGKQRTYHNRTLWAINHMKQAGLLKPGGKNGLYQITDEGRKVLSENPVSINVQLLKRYPKYLDFIGGKKDVDASSLPAAITQSEQTPEEILGGLAEQLNKQLALDLLDSIYANSPTFFESLVVDLLLKMGYGGLGGSGQVTRKTADGGIDGVIKQDELGLDQIYTGETMGQGLDDIASGHSKVCWSVTRRGRHKRRIYHND